jgi:hypothetical protein
MNTQQHRTRTARPTRHDAELDVHYHHIHRVDVSCDELTHCPSHCSCPIDACDVTLSELAVGQCVRVSARNSARQGQYAQIVERTESARAISGYWYVLRFADNATATFGRIELRTFDNARDERGVVVATKIDPLDGDATIFVRTSGRYS